MLGWWRRRGLTSVGAACVAIGFPLLLVLVAGTGGVLWHPSGFQGTIDDVRYWLGWRSYPGQSSDPFPLLRDYPALSIIVGFSASLWVIYAQFLAFEDAQDDLKDNECFELSPSAPLGADIDTLLTKRVSDLNGKLREIGRASAPLAGVFLAIGVAMALAQPRYGSFTYFAPRSFHGTRLTAWRELAYSHWWASFRPLRLTFVFWWVIGSLGLYLVTMQTLVGLRYFEFIRSLSGEIDLVPNVHDPDGYFGWGKLHRILTTMVLGIVCSTFSGVGAAGLLYPIVGIVWSMLVMIFFIANVSVITAMAVLELRKKTRAYVRREVQLTLSAMPALSASSNLDEILLTNALADRVDRLHSIPTLPIRYSSVVLGFAGASIAIVAGIFQVLEYFK